MQQLSKVIETVLFDSSNWRFKLLTNWPQIVGQLSQHVQIIKINEDQLILGAQGSAWIHETFMLRHEIQRTVNNYLGGNYITDVRVNHYIQQSIKSEEQASQTPDKRHYTGIRSRPLNNKELAALDNVKDVTLRASLHKYLLSCTLT